MKFKKIGNIMEGQDGAIWNGLLFRFNHAGKCAVYDLAKIAVGDDTAICTFTLEKTDVIMPHSNAVFFGTEYYSPEDEFPLLYTNVYNNYSACEDRKLGICCVYRIQRNGNNFNGQLVQVIQIEFVDNDALWCSPQRDDVRPYGNFVSDTDNGVYYAFTMRDCEKTTKYFSFAMPKIADGTFDSTLGVKKVVLGESDIVESFDCEYHRFLQGAIFYKGKIYSLEGFGHDKINRPAIRVINPNDKTQEQFILFENFDSPTEPELIDFWDDVCYYADNPGNLYILSDI